LVYQPDRSQRNSCSWLTSGCCTFQWHSMRYSVSIFHFSIGGSVLGQQQRLILVDSRLVLECCWCHCSGSSFDNAVLAAFIARSQSKVQSFANATMMELNVMSRLFSKTHWACFAHFQVSLHAFAGFCHCWEWPIFYGLSIRQTEIHA
jgi:hypothetical protein